MTVILVEGDNVAIVCRYFLWRFSILCSTLNFLADSYTWPLLVYMLLICVYPFTSSCAHTFSTMSPESRHICYFFDYGALSLYSLGKVPYKRSDCSFGFHLNSSRSFRIV